MEALEPLRYFSVVISTYSAQPINGWNLGGISADLDNDGDIDFLEYSYIEGKLIGGQQQPDGSVLKYSAGPDAPGRSIVGTADIDLDGDLDVLSVTSAANRQSNEVIWQFNDGTGCFVDGGFRLLPAYPIASVPEDLDRDGDVDFAMLYSDGALRGTAIFVNDGTGNFDIPRLLDGSGIDTGGGAAAADLDGDDDIDLAIPVNASTNPSERALIRVFLNDGRGGFALGENIIVGDQYTLRVSPADFDDDGDIDLLTARYTSSPTPSYRIVLLSNDGAGHYPMRQELPVLAYPWQYFLVVDLNGDSMQDVVEGFSNKVLWNDGSGTLLPPVPLLPTTSASPSTAIDFNTDGRRDIMTFGATWLASGFTDTLRPVASRPAYVYSPQAGNPALRLDFSEDVRQTLRAADFQLTNLTTGQLITTTDLKLNYSAGDIASLLLSNSLPDGNYRLTIAAAAVADIAGNTLASDFTFDFTVLSGDANRDRKIDAADLGVLSANWQGVSKTFSQGDFNYDGKVDVNDLYILASKWQQTLPPPVPPALPLSIVMHARRTPTRVVLSVL